MAGNHLNESQLNKFANKLLEIVLDFLAFGAVLRGQPIDGFIEIGLAAEPHHPGSSFIEAVGIA